MIDLEKFVSKNNSWINMPFSRNGYTYATNGHLAVRVARTDVPENAKAPDLAKLFNRAIASREPPWMGLPSFKLKQKKCVACKGTGFIDGDGESCARTDPNRDECQGCMGDGEIFSGSAIVKAERGEVTLAARYLELLKDLPGIKIGVFGDESKRTDKPIRFKFDGGQGLLMPIRM